jgi:hypothetical protein
MNTWSDLKEYIYAFPKTRYQNSIYTVMDYWLIEFNKIVLNAKLSNKEIHDSLKLTLTPQVKIWNPEHIAKWNFDLDNLLLTPEQREEKRQEIILSVAKEKAKPWTNITDFIAKNKFYLIALGIIIAVIIFFISIKGRIK